MRHQPLVPVHLALAAVAASVACAAAPPAGGSHAMTAHPLRLLPYPQDVQRLAGALPLGPPEVLTNDAPSPTETLAADNLRAFLPRRGRAIAVRLGSAEEGYDRAWLSREERAFLQAADTSPEASVLHITPDGITIVGKGRFGMLYGVQTVNQLAREAARQGAKHLPCLAIRDWPALRWRCLSPTLTWYSGWNRLEGYDLCNYTEDEWKWLVDWSLLHKLNAWAVCICGYWPFTLPGYEESTLDVDSFFFNPKTGQKEPRRFVHRNIQAEFYPRVIRYAQERGIHVYAYMAINSFDGGYMLHHPEANAGGAAEMLPFAPGVHEYTDAFIGRLVEMGFDGFVFENPEAYHVPNQNDECYRTFWEPWAEKYGFHSRAETDENNAPLGVHVEYYTWLFREYDGAIRRHAARLNRGELEVYLISHVVLSRIVAESKTEEEREYWLRRIDEAHGRKVPFITVEDTEQEYVDLLGGDRVASLGGRGGSCLCAWRRMTGVNSNHTGGPMGASVDWERDCQRRLYKAGGFGAMAYVFEWRSNEIYGYIGAQTLWRPDGVPQINNDDQIGLLDYAYRVHYGDRVGALVAQALDTSSCVSDSMVLDDVYGAQWPGTGTAYHREYQLLAAQADTALGRAREAYHLFTGREPDLNRPAYDQDAFRWTGYDPAADHLFKEESLRWLCVELRRAQLLCDAALAHRLATRRAAEGAPVGEVLGLLDTAIAAAAENQRLYQVNFDDDYHWNEGLCVTLTDRLRSMRLPFELRAAEATPLQAWDFSGEADLQGWTQVNDLTPPAVENGALTVQATGPDPFMVCTQRLAIPASDRQVVEIELASDRRGWAELFWWTTDEPGPASRLLRFEVATSDEPTLYVLRPKWGDTIAGLRLDTPDGAKVRITAIRVVDPGQGAQLSAEQLREPVPPRLQRTLGEPLFIPWEKLTDQLPAAPTARKPGLYLSLHLGLNTLRDVYCHGVVFTVQAREGAQWRTIFRRTLGKNTTAWEHWDVPLPRRIGVSPVGRDGQPTRLSTARPLRLRFLTDAYSRAQHRDSLSWEWPLWGQPEVIEIAPDGSRRVLYRFADHLQDAETFVRLDRDGRERRFDGEGTDSSGAAFRLLQPSPLAQLRAGEGAQWQWVEGFAEGLAGAHGPYNSYLGSVDSWWSHQDPAFWQDPAERGEVSWRTAAVPSEGPNGAGAPSGPGPDATHSAPPGRDGRIAFAFIGGTDYGEGEAELLADGRHLLNFRTGSAADARWQEADVELRYYHGGDTRDARITYGLSGIFVLLLPADQVTPGQPLQLTVKLLSGGHAWFMVHAFPSALQAAERVIPPDPLMPTICAFTPHRDGQYGITEAEFVVALPNALD